MSSKTTYASFLVTWLPLWKYWLKQTLWLRGHLEIVYTLMFLCLPRWLHMKMYWAMYISYFTMLLISVQFTSVAQSCPTLWDPMDFHMPGFPIHHQFSELAQIHVHWVSDTIQTARPLSSHFPPAFNLSQHQGLFQWVSSLHQVVEGLELQLQHQSLQWKLRTDFLNKECDIWWVIIMFYSLRLLRCTSHCASTWVYYLT